MGGGSSSKKQGNRFGEGDDEDKVFSAGHELVFAAVGQLSFADSVMVDPRVTGSHQAADVQVNKY